MSPFQYALLKLSEECNEVAQAASKTMQFGYDSVCPKTGISNHEALVNELHDVLGCVVNLITKYELEFNFDFNRSKEKVLKIEHYMEYSVREGFVTK